MSKKLVNLIAAAIVSTGIFLTGCGNSYKNPLKPENRTTKQKQFINNVHRLYGEQVTYRELRRHVRNKLGGYKADIVNHCLKKYVKKENCYHNIPPEVLVVIHEAIERLD